MAKSVKARTAHTVYGADLDQETMALARMSGAIDGPLTEENLRVREGEPGKADIQEEGLQRLQKLHVSFWRR